MMMMKRRRRFNPEEVRLSNRITKKRRKRLKRRMKKEVDKVAKENTRRNKRRKKKNNLRKKEAAKPEKKEPEKKAEDKKEDPESLVALRKSDPQIKSLAYDVYDKPAASQSVLAAQKSLIAKFHTCSVVKSGAEALEELKTILGDHKSSISLGYSTTLEQIGFHSFLKSKECQDIKNYKGEAAAADAKDRAKASELRVSGLSADIFFTGVAAISEDGVIVSADASSTRIGGLTAAKKKAVIVVGANKIVKDEKAAMARLTDYQLPLESARARVAYAAYGSKGSQIAYQAVIKTGTMFLPQRIHVIIIDGLSYGF